MENDYQIVLDRGTVIEIMMETFGTTLEYALMWLNTPNIYFNGWTPDETIHISGVQRVLDALEVAKNALIDDQKREEEGEDFDE